MLAARERLRAKLSYTNLGFALAPETFTISELRDLYAAALGHEVSATNLQRDPPPPRRARAHRRAAAARTQPAAGRRRCSASARPTSRSPTSSPCCAHPAGTRRSNASAGTARTTRRPSRAQSWISSQSRMSAAGMWLNGKRSFAGSTAPPKTCAANGSNGSFSSARAELSSPSPCALLAARRRSAPCAKTATGSRSSSSAKCRTNPRASRCQRPDVDAAAEHDAAVRLERRRTSAAGSTLDAAAPRSRSVAATDSATSRVEPYRDAYATRIVLSYSTPSRPRPARRGQSGPPLISPRGSPRAHQSRRRTTIERPRPRPRRGRPRGVAAGAGLGGRELEQPALAEPARREEEDRRLVVRR